MKFVIRAMFCFSLVGCSTPKYSDRDHGTNEDIELGKKYPECEHIQKIVFQKCVELNQKGEKVNAIRVHKLMEEGKI